MIILICMIGFGMTLGSCGGKPPAPEGGILQPPSQPESPPQPDETDSDINAQIVNPSDLIATAVKIFLPPPIYQCPPDDTDIDLKSIPGGHVGLGTIIPYENSVAILTHDHIKQAFNPKDAIVALGRVVRRRTLMKPFSHINKDPF